MPVSQKDQLTLLIPPYDHLATAAESFLLDRKTANLSPRTVEYYAFHLRGFAGFCDGQGIARVEQITPDTLRRYLLFLESCGRNAGGRHSAYRALRAFFRWLEAESEGYTSPLRKVRPPKVDVPPIEGVSLADVQAMLDTCKGQEFTAARDKALLLVLLDTGIRIGECLAMNWEDVDFGTGSILIRRGKNRRARMVFVGRIARQALRVYAKHRKDDNQAVWVTIHSERMTYDAVREVLRRRSKLAGLAEVPSPHDFRRTCALTLLRNGADVVSVSRLLGHSSLEITKRYLAQTEDDLMAAHRQFSPVDRLKKP